MMLSELDKKIDTALIILAKSKDCISKADNLENADISRENNIVNLLVERGLALRLKDTIYNLNYVELKIPMCKITPKGIEIFNKGGWLKHLEYERIKFIRAEQKEIFDYKISKWEAKTFWPVLILGLFGGIYSAIDLYEKVITKSFNQEQNFINQPDKPEINPSNELVNKQDQHLPKNKVNKVKSE